ncbi:MAG: ribbon-helix-helix domain-containing protein [Steroidobacteraceae bacterium]
MTKTKKPSLSPSSIERGLRHKEQITTALGLEQIAAINGLIAPGGKRAGVPKSVLFREAIDDLLAKHGVKVRA